MLVAFSCKNYGPFRDQAVFSMEATAMNEYRDFNTFMTPHGTCLKSAFIFGANGSGKTNLFKAIEFMKQMVLFSIFDGRAAMRNSHFQFHSNANEIPTGFEMTFAIEDVLWSYGFELLKGKVIKEWLTTKQKRSTKVFERTSSDWKSISLYGKWKKFDSIKEHTRDNALFLSLAAMLNVAPAISLRDWFEKLLVYTNIDELSPGETVGLLEEDPEIKQEILSFLRTADLGIDDFEIEIEEEDMSENEKQDTLKSFTGTPEQIKMVLNLKKRSIDLNTLHRIYDDDNKDVGSVSLPFIKFQSAGTIKMFELLGPILRTLRNGGTLIIDEIDSKLHPLLIRYIVALFHSLDKNVGNGQLICNTHDALLFEEPIRRDQFWFIKKSNTGASELYSLADFQNVRKNDLLLKKYLVGVFGAIPFSYEGEPEAQHAE
ncbi:ATP-binding protein [Cohnella sp. LGH]|uniref:AAA family ATPase n=1 Tax=Cohnella sp. LGH TaxID=1619153 RepID=UPI001ADA04DB|nr:ATP-binding protein [Cohnella sp. LGH]QTH42669.1 ATP-binding protein [Cohnella sp. LGH]